MKQRTNPTFVEWGFVASLFALCAILSVLQYRWTGELAEAEKTRLQSDLEDRAEAFSRAFDAELSESRAQLVVASDEAGSKELPTITLERYRKWRTSNPRPIFGRVAVVAPVGEKFELWGIDQSKGLIASMDWPAEWAGLRDNLARRVTGIGAPPYTDPAGVLLEFPIFGGARNGAGPSIRGWTILEIDLKYARERWLPDLIRACLNPDGKLNEDVEIKSASDSSKVIYATQNISRKEGREAVSARLNRGGRYADIGRGPLPNGRWILEVQRRTGSLEAIVAESRRKNLAVALALTLLILAAGSALVYYTRRSRQFAEAQMNFVANVSHELRTPLTVIRGAAHNLERGVVRDPGRILQYAGLIIRHTEQLSAMVEQVLELAGAQKNRFTVSRKSISLVEVLRAAVSAAAPETEAANCSVHIALPHSLPEVYGDSAALRRVFQNLIANAAKHGGKNGKIEIHAGLANGGRPPMVEVEVADSGPGIPENELSKIFTPFFRGTRAQSEQIRGSGLGLSLAREIVEAHEGRISVKSEHGSGAKFLVQLPVIAPAPSHELAHTAC